MGVVKFSYQRILSFVIILFVFSFLSCKKEPVISLPSLSTTEVSSITNESASSGGQISNDGGAEILSRGVCWNMNPNPTTDNGKTSDGKGSGSFTSDVRGLSPGVKYYLRAYATNSLGTAYGNQIEFSTESRQPEKFITASVGGTITTYESIKLVIPPNALTKDGIVSIGRTGNEPTTIPNNRLIVTGVPISLKLPSDTLNKPLILSYPINESIADTALYSVYAFNGTSYLPLKCSIKDKVVTVEIEFNQIYSTSAGTKSILEDIKIIGVMLSQNGATLYGEMGLKEVSINNGKISLSQINSQNITADTKILLMIHGWGGWPSTWEYFANLIMNDNSVLKYDKFWTFGYNSSKSIDENGEILKNLLQQNGKGAAIDIVAHSMGGLVARAMVEKKSGAIYVYRLVTLGTPHLGSDLAVLRNVIGIIAGSNSFSYLLYNHNTEGFRDLYEKSDFIKSLSTSPNTSVPYYVIACKNGEIGPISFLINGDDDGVVSVESAQGVISAEKPDSVLTIPVILAHLKLRETESIYLQVKSFLLKSKPVVSLSQIVNITYKSANITGTISSNGGYPIDESGLYWGENSDPLNNGNKIKFNNNTGPFTSILNGLSPSTKYYIVAFARNKLGISYSEKISFTTSPLPANSIYVTSFPPGASIYLNGANMNLLTPNIINSVNPGTHHIRVYKYGYNEYNKTITLETGSSASIHANLGNPLPPLPFFTITNPSQNISYYRNVLTVTGTVVLKSATGATTAFTGNKAILTLNGVDQEIYVNNGSFSQEILIKSGQNKLRLRANSPNGDTGTSEEIVFNGEFSTQDIQILLRWNNGTTYNPKDVDLHVYDSYNRHTYWLCTDKYINHSGYYNAITNIIPGSNLDFDNTIGYGPETFSLNRSTNTIYTVKVHFYQGHEAYNPTDANIQIILGGTVLKTYGPFRFRNSYADTDTYYEDPDCWWDVVSFRYINGEFSIVNSAQTNNNEHTQKTYKKDYKK